MKTYRLIPSAIVATVGLLPLTGGAATLITYGSASSIGNGSLFSDPAGIVAPAGVAVNGAAVFSSNAVGRALIQNGTNPPTTIGNLASITDNHGVDISGWTNYRWRYTGGSNAMGFLEDAATRLNVGGANNGSAMSNSSDFILVSDSITIPLGAAADTFDISLLAGTDSIDQVGVTGPNSFDLGVYLVLDDTTWVTVSGGTTVTGLPSDANDRESFTGIAAGTGYTSARVVFTVDAPSLGGNAVRGLLDNIQVTVIPEPSVALLGAFGLLGLLRRWR